MFAFVIDKDEHGDKMFELRIYIPSGL